MASSSRLAHEGDGLGHVLEVVRVERHPGGLAAVHHGWATMPIFSPPNQPKQL